MRLTLRTLLAYLDNTLDPESADALREKIAESGFATQLVRRVRATLENPSLAAPSPDARGPVEDANVISEYLDSTLPAEQVAEIERACLESDPHLAEVAACHQILTIVLGTQAKVSPQLRKRIYELPDRSLEEIASSDRFSGISMPESPALQPLAGDEGLSTSASLPTADATHESAAESIQPVGVSDSGVSDAPTRLREAEEVTEFKGRRPAMAGAKGRTADDSLIYAGSIRPSRIVPWLVTLALVAVLGVAMVKIFRPLLNPSAPDQSTALVESSDPIISVETVIDQEVIGADENEQPSDSAVDVSSQTDDRSSTNQSADSNDQSVTDRSQTTDSQTDSTDTASGVDTATDPTSRDQMEEVPSNVTDDASVDAFTTDGPPVPPSAESPTGATGDGDTSNQGAPAAGSRDESTPAAPPSTNVQSDVGSDRATGASDDSGAASTATNANAEQDSDSEMSADQTESDTTSNATARTGTGNVPPPANAVVDPGIDKPAASEVARITSESALVAARVGNQWVRVNPDAPIVADIPLAAAPTFRVDFAIKGARVTVVGPSTFSWSVTDDDITTLNLQYGRAIIASTEPDARVGVRLGEYSIELVMPEIETVAAISHRAIRVPGFDPLSPDSRIPIARVYAAQGSFTIQEDGQTHELTTGQQWVRRGDQAASISAADSVPNWLEPADPAEESLLRNARETLLELLDPEQPLEISLREALLFRQAEVAALAARTLLNMGIADVYFGGDGILSNPKQRFYWTDHFDALVAMVDRSVESAQQVKEAIESMDAPNADTLFRLLTGYSQAQLVEGGDEELVELLDSPSMAVRVLAIENLNRIVGTKLYYRADQETEARREEAVKKWLARLRKGEIRWQE